MSDSENRPQPAAIPDLLDVNETAAILRVGHTYVYESSKRFLATGDTHEIPAIKVGRLLRIPRVALERFIGGPITWPIPVVEQAPEAAVALKDRVADRPAKRVGPSIAAVRRWLPPLPPLDCSSPEERRSNARSCFGSKWWVQTVARDRA